jgi:Fur family ferric uptake transcriptional regulator
MKDIEDKFREYLKSKRLKLTPQREAILRETLSLHHHFDVEELFEKLRKKGERISRATIYRILPLLMENNIIKEAQRCQDNVIKYEHICGHDHHDHLICIKCGKIYEFKDEQIEKLQDNICKRYKFKPVEHRLGIRGYCQKCRGG